MKDNCHPLVYPLMPAAAGPGLGSIQVFCLGGQGHATWSQCHFPRAHISRKPGLQQSVLEPDSWYWYGCLNPLVKFFPPASSIYRPIQTFLFLMKSLFATLCVSGNLALSLGSSLLV